MAWSRTAMHQVPRIDCRFSANPDLLSRGGVGRAARATGGVPAALRELQAAVVAVAGVDRPVAARLALGELVPDRSRCWPAAGAGAGAGSGAGRGRGACDSAGAARIVGRGGRARRGRARQGAGQSRSMTWPRKIRSGLSMPLPAATSAQLFGASFESVSPGWTTWVGRRRSPGDAGEADDADGGNRRGDGSSLHGSL